MQPLPDELRELIHDIQTELRAERVGALAAFLRAAPIDLYTRMEFARTRRSEWMPALSWWESLSPKEVPQLGQLADGWAALGLASLHWIGFVREAAVRALAWHDEGDVLPFLILRLNDWVEPVRRVALAGVRARLTAAHAEHWIRVLPLVDLLRRQSRADHRTIVDAIEALLRSPEARPALPSGLASSHARTRRLCFRLALASDDRAFLGPALANHDPVVRFEAARQLRALPAGEPRRQAVAVVLGDRSAGVRAVAMSLLEGEPEPWRRAQLERLGCDGSAAIRAVARRQLPLDWAARYRALLGDPTHGLAAISGLGETGSEEDVLAIEPFLTAASPRLRAAALSATAALDVDSVALFVEALADPSARVARVAARALQRRTRRGLADLVRALAERPDVPPHARRHALSVASTLHFWPRLLWMLDAAASPCRALAELAATHLRGRTNEAPTPAQLAEIDRALAVSPLPRAAIAAIEDELAFWRAP